MLACTGFQSFLAVVAFAFYTIKSKPTGRTHSLGPGVLKIIMWEYEDETPEEMLQFRPQLPSDLLEDEVLAGSFRAVELTSQWLVHHSTQWDSHSGTALKWEGWIQPRFVLLGEKGRATQKVSAW